MNTSTPIDTDTIMPSIHQTIADLTGNDTAAWKMKIPQREGDPKQFAAIDSWIVYAKWSHPFWPYHLVSAVALREAPGVEPAIIRVPGATHEIFVAALHPDIEPLIEGPIQTLSPINFTAQLILPSDQDMNKILLHTVEEIIAGKLNPDTDGTKGWVLRFGADGFKEPYRQEYEAWLASTKKGVH